MADTESKTNAVSSASKIALSLSALGVVFGDIGTSPLYTLKTVLALTGANPSQAATLGALSLIVWTLVMVTTVKYVSFAMRIDNDGEGGILALMSLLGVRLHSRPFIVVIGLLGASLIYGDGAVTPAISVLSAIEGIKIVDPDFAPYVLPTSVIILIGLFLIQPQGTARIGKAFGPIMLLWFAVIGLLGIYGISRHPSVFVAINPLCGLSYLFSGGWGGFLVLGSVFLCVTGAEALYADMGHFGAKPIRFAWSWIVFPSLILNYAGQAAIVMEGASLSDNIFFRLCPASCMIPMVMLSTVATIIASQSIITGAFSMTRQAIQLGWLPRLQIRQTSEEGYGQIYVGAVNWILMLITVGLAIGFGKSDNLAAAYGIAVSATMLATSFLLFIAMREIWQWSVIKAGTVAGVFILIDAAFFTSNLSKFLAGGYVPVLLAIMVYGVMYIWHRGAAAVAIRLQETVVPIGKFMQSLVDNQVPRVKGTAVFMTRTQEDAPPIMVWHLKHNRSLHEQLFVLTVVTGSVPYIKDEGRISVKQIAPDFWRATARYGFMEHPDIPALLKQAHHSHGCTLDLSDVTYYIGHETVIMAEDDKNALPAWIELPFAFMQRNCLHVSDYFKLPSDRLVEIGRQISV